MVSDEIDTIDTTNSQCVGVQGDRIVILLPRQAMTRAEAIRHAAWLVAVADDEDDFPAVLAAVRNT